jgi:HK97 family phage portal protein
MAGIKTETILEQGALKAIVGIPGWAETFGDAAQGAGDPVSAWASVPLLYRAVSLRASSLSSVPFVVFKGEEEVEWPLEPDLPTIIYSLELGLLLTGAAYALKQHVGRLLTGVQILNPTTVKWEHKHGKDRFTQRVASRRYGPWSADKIMALREPSMTADTGAGLAPAQVALQASKLRFNMDEFASQFFAHGAQPQTLITTTGNPGQTEMERAQSFFKRRMSGVGNAWRTLFLRGDLKVTTLTPELKSLGMKELAAHVALDIGAALGVPRSILESDAANYATSQTDMQSFWHMTVRPRLPMYENAINAQLLAGTDYSLQFAPEQLDVFQEDETIRAASLLQLVQAGVPLDDAMLMLGYDPIENRPEPPVAEGVEETPEEDLIESELATWQRYALRSLGKNGKSRPFVAEHIPAHVVHEIQADLEEADDAETVKAAFLHQEAKRTPVVPRGNAKPVAPVPAADDIHIDIDAAIEQWNDVMPNEAQGMLDAEVIDRWRYDDEQKL